MDFSVTFPEDGGTSTVNYTGDSKYTCTPHGVLVIEDTEYGKKSTYSPTSWVSIEEQPKLRRGLIA